MTFLLVNHVKSLLPGGGVYAPGGVYALGGHWCLSALGNVCSGGVCSEHCLISMGCLLWGDVILGGDVDLGVSTMGGACICQKKNRSYSRGRSAPCNCSRGVVSQHALRQTPPRTESSACKNYYACPKLECGR